MPSTYTPIATTTVGSAVASVTFSSIASTYTDLIIVVAGTVNTGITTLELQFNSDTGSNYSNTSMRGTGSSASSSRQSSQVSQSSGFIDTTVSNSIIQIMNYSNATTYKTTIARGNSSAYGTGAFVNLWRSTAAINAVKVEAGGYNFQTGSTLTLYGVKSA
jgi:hypothetical protein